MTKITGNKTACYCIGFRRAAAQITRHYDRGFAAIGLTANQFFLLSSINALESCNKSQLASHTLLDRTTIIRNLQILLRKELILESPVRLTVKGKNSVRDGNRLWKALQKEVETKVGEDAIPLLRSFLDDMQGMELLAASCENDGE